MPDINMANRQCCDLDIREYSTNKPWMYADFCNTTTAGFSGNSTFAMKKGAKSIKFDDPIEGTMKITFAVHPFRIYALLSDGSIETSAVVPVKTDIKATTAGTLSLGENVTPVTGSVFVYAQGDFGGTEITGTVAGGTFTPSETSSIAINTTYTVAYLETKSTGINKVSFNNKKIPKDYRITQKTVDKNENGVLVPILITAYKASPKKELELNFSSTGDPSEITITFDCMEDKDGNVLDMVEETSAE